MLTMPEGPLHYLQRPYSPDFSSQLFCIALVSRGCAQRRDSACLGPDTPAAMLR